MPNKVNYQQNNAHGCYSNRINRGRYYSTVPVSVCNISIACHNRNTHVLVLDHSINTIKLSTHIDKVNHVHFEDTLKLITLRFFGDFNETFHNRKHLKL